MKWIVLLEMNSEGADNGGNRVRKALRRKG
jgi:hypothetical protein